MNWVLKITKPALKDLAKLPEKDRIKIKIALREMEDDPFVGDIKSLHNYSAGWRRRVGSYRIFYDVYQDLSLIVISAIKRRTSKTY